MGDFENALSYVKTSSSFNELRMLIEVAIQRRKALGSAHSRNFRQGDPIKFKDSRTGRYVQGTFHRHLRKNVEVKVDFQTWRLSPSLLERDE